MLDRMMQRFDFHADALRLRAERQTLLASNIANADTPNYKARDFNFPLALGQMKSAQSQLRQLGSQDKSPQNHPKVDAQPMASLPMQRSAAQHFSRDSPASSVATSNRAMKAEPAYRNAEQAAMDGNTVDMDRERANFLDNSLRYESTLRFMNSSLRQMLSAIKGD